MQLYKSKINKWGEESVMVEDVLPEAKKMFLSHDLYLFVCLLFLFVLIASINKISIFSTGFFFVILKPTHKQ